MRLTTVIAILCLIGCVSTGVPTSVQGGDNVSQTPSSTGTSAEKRSLVDSFPKPINTSVCMNSGGKLQKYPTTTKKIGVAVYPEIYDSSHDKRLEKNEIGVFIIPYLINFFDKQLFLVVADDNSEKGNFVPPCDKEWKGGISSSVDHLNLSNDFIKVNLGYYPFLVLSKSQENTINSFISKSKCEKDSPCPMNDKPVTVGRILYWLFESEPPDFLGTQPLRWLSSETPSPSSLAVEAGGTSKKQISYSIDDSIKKIFSQESFTYMTVVGGGCTLIDYSNMSCDTEPSLNNPVTLKIKGFDKIPLLPLSKEKVLQGLNFTIHTQIGKTKGTSVFPISKIRQKACISVDSVNLCTTSPISVKDVVESSDTKPMKLVPEVKKEDKSSSAGNQAGLHKLIVVSLSDGLRTKGKIIQDSLYEALSKLCKNKSAQTNFTLLTIESGRKRITVLNSQELAEKLCQTVGTTVGTNEDQLSTQIQNGMSFSAQDLRSMDDLELVDSFIADRADSQNTNEQVGKVLYLTDDGSLPDKIPRKQLGVPLAWKNDNIILEVVTTKDCKPWQEKAKVDETLCFPWNQDHALTSSGKDSFSLSQLIETFLQNPK